MTREEALNYKNYHNIELILNEEKLKADKVDPKEIIKVFDEEILWKDRMIKVYEEEQTVIYAGVQSGSLGVAGINGLERINKEYSLKYIKNFYFYDKYEKTVHDYIKKIETSALMREAIGVY